MSFKIVMIVPFFNSKAWLYLIEVCVGPVTVFHASVRQQDETRDFIIMYDSQSLSDIATHHPLFTYLSVFVEETGEN